MPTYSYQALDAKGQRVQGTEEAQDKARLVAQLTSKGFQPVSIKRTRAISSLWEAGKRLHHEDLLYLTGELADLLDAGVPLERALAIVAEASGRDLVRSILLDIRQKIQSGQGFSEALAAYPESFSRLYVNMIRVGELGGVLAEVLRRLGEFLERSREVRKFIITSSIYPCILATVGILSVFILVTFVVPKFGQIFEDLNQPMPVMTRIIVQVSMFLQNWWWIMTLGAIGLSAAAWAYLKTPQGIAWRDETVLNIPWVGPMIKRVEIGRFSRTLGTLIESGVPILKGITLSKEVVSNRVIRQSIDELYVGVRQGKGMSQLIKKMSVFPLLMVHLVAIGEETGGLGPMLLKVADDLEDKVRSDTRLYLSLVEPLTIVIMGLIIGGIILSMLLAIFGINEISF